MKKVNVLLGTEVFNKNILLSYWSILYENVKNLKNYNLDINFYYSINDKLLDCDIIILSSRFFYKKNFENIQNILLILKEINKKNSNIIWFDLRDSAGTTQFEVMPYVKKYVKGQLYKNINYYSQLMYGGRYYTNYYFLNNKISDDIPYEMTLLDKKYYHKLSLSWNIGTLRYDLRLSSLYKAASYSQIFTKILLKKNFTKFYNYNSFEKKYRVNAIYNKNFERKSVAFQRFLANEKMINRNKFDLINKQFNKKKYFSLIRQSKVVLSLFGWGEVCYRDWESIIMGSPFIKPDMSYLETWPNIYIPNETYYSVKLNLENLDDVINFSLSSSKKSINMVKKSQEIIKSIRLNNGKNFCDKFLDIINI